MKKFKKYLLVLLTVVFVTAQLAPQPRSFASDNVAQNRGAEEVAGDVPSSAATDIVIDDGETKEELAASLLGSGVTASNIQFKGTPASAATFSGASTVFGFDSGIILSTGQAKDVLGVNNPADGKETSTVNDIPGDTDLTGLTSHPTFDATVLEFDFIPQTSNITFTYSFGSEEYLEYVGEYNDAFALYVNGVNKALVPGTVDPVSVNTINNIKNPQYFKDNTAFPSPYPTTVNGFTTGFKVNASVNANQVNHIKLAIADSEDYWIDSHIFISSLSAALPEEIHTVSTDAANGTVTGGGDYSENEIVVLNATPAEGYEFVGWESDDITIANPLNPSLSFSMPDKDVHVKAKFVKTSYTLIYDGNGNTSGVAPTGGSYKQGSTVTVYGQGNLVRPGYTFTGWNTKADGSGTSYSAGGTLAMPANDVTLYAQWAVNQHQLMYDGNGHTGGVAPIVPTNYDFDETVTVLGNSGATPFEKTGYTFAGWNTKADGTGTAYSGTGTETFKMPDANVTLYAQWDINNSEVKYDGNGSTAGTAPVVPTSYDYNETVTVLGNSSGTPYEKTGYTFTGWNTKADGTGTAYVGTGTETFKMPNASVTLYAQWDINQYEVNYDGNGSTAGVAPAAAAMVNFDQTVTVHGNSGTTPYEKTGYTFTGWNTKADGTGDVYTGTGTETFKMPDKNVTLYAQWQINQHEVAYDGNGSTAGVVPAAAAMVNFDQTITVLGNSGAVPFEKTGYTFTGWNTKADGTGEAYTGTGTETFKMPDQNVTLYAQWKINQYEVSYDGNGSTGGIVPAASENYDYNETVTVLGNSATVPYVKIGYTFTGWNTKADGTGDAYTGIGTETFKMPDENVTLYAQWGINQREVKYEGNGSTGGVAPADGAIYDFDQTVTVLGNTGIVPYEKTGYTFTGWNTKADGTGTGYVGTGTETFKMPDQSVTLYAQWEINQYEVNYDGNGNTSGQAPSGPATYDYDEVITVLDNNNTTPYEKTGYTFTGWNTKADGTGNAYTGTETFQMPAENVALYAQWEINQHEVNYDGNGNTSGEAPAESAKVNFDQTITVLGNSGAVPFEKTGNTFTGWNTKADGTGDAYTGTGTETFQMPDANVTLYAQWEINQYEVSYDGNGSTSGVAPAESATYDYNETVTVLANSGATPYEKTGNTFTGWNTKADGTGDAYKGTGTETFQMPDENVTLYAQWEINQYEVNYDGNGNTSGEAPSGPATYDYDEVITVLDNNNTTPYEKTGHTFTGWNTKADGTGDAYSGAETFQTPAENVTLYAQWEINQYEVKYDGNGNTSGEAPAELVSYDYDQPVTVLGNSYAIPYEKTGYTFTGWNTKVDGTGDAYTGAGTETFKMPDENVTLYAQWEINQYEVKYDGNGSTGGKAPAEPAIYEFDQIVTVLGNNRANPYEKTGYTFTGWNTKADGTGDVFAGVGKEAFTMPAENVTLYAQWKMNPVPAPKPQVESPKTGDMSNGNCLAILALLTAGIFMILPRNRRA